MPESKISNSKLIPLFVGIPALIILVAVIFIAAGRREAPHLAMPPQKVILGMVEARDITDSREYVAVMEADNMVDLRARIAGFLVAKNFEDGDLVNDGQILFQIEPDQYQALVDNAEGNVLSAQAQLDRATLDFNRTSDLFRKNTSPKSDYDKAKADYEMAQAALMSSKATLAQSRLNLGYAAIKAPFDGQVSDTPYSEGSLLGPDSGVLATVVSVDPILVTFGISDKIVAVSQKEDPAKERTMSDWQVRLRLGADNYYPTPGQFSYISPTVDPKTDTVKFKAKFKNPDKILRPGQIVTAVVERTNPEKQLVVPKEAVLTDPDGNYMLMPKEIPADPNKPGSQPGLVAEARRVTLGNGDALDKEYIIKEGLQEGEKFILKGLMSAGAMLRPGAPIDLSEPSAAPVDRAQPEEGEAK